MTSITSGGFSIDNKGTENDKIKHLDQKLKCNKEQLFSIKMPKPYSKTLKKKRQLVVRHQHPKRQSFFVRVTTLVIWQLILVFRNLKKLSLQTAFPLLALIIYFYAINGDIRQVDLAIGKFILLNILIRDIFM